MTSVGIIPCMTLPGTIESNAGNDYTIPLFHISIDILQAVETDSFYQMVNI